MPVLQEIDDTLFQNTLTHAVYEVFKTMVGHTVTPLSDAPDDTPNTLSIHGPQVVGTVGFIGSINGLLYLYLGADLARHISARLLDMTDTEIDDAGDEVVNDAIGELTNMTVGTFKNQLCDLGYPCRLTIPSILRGTNFTIEPISTTTRRVYRFDIHGHTLVADLLMKPTPDTDA
ncbi:chemotaxis protein CheX [Geminisphaera colitermitum]|uniref:chemotaxis protein CheX n=1 Tax=Geminisphaera colitermitum TaxID=1148786 RepID=UPI0005B83D10|nr:chemotaxis protein CheX [Geminisphaera colitermitum]